MNLIQVFSPHFDADIFPLRVTVSNKVLDETLNSGFYDPNSLQHATNFFATYAEFAITAPGAVDVPIRACMISPEINKYAVARFVFVALLVSVTAGVLAGFFTSRIDIGWALGGGMIALVAAFEMVFLWLLK
jgi:hypothetical protein